MFRYGEEIVYVKKRAAQGAAQSIHHNHFAARGFSRFMDFLVKKRR